MYFIVFIKDEVLNYDVICCKVFEKIVIFFIWIKFFDVLKDEIIEVGDFDVVVIFIFDVDLFGDSKIVV